MINNRKMVLSLLLLAPFYFSNSIAHSFFEEIVREMDEFEQRLVRRINRMNEETKKGFANYDFAMEMASITINDNKKNNSVDIVISPLAIQEKTFDATMDQDTHTLTVTTPVGIAIIQVDRHVVSVTFNQQIKQDTHQKHGKQQVVMSSYNQTAKTVSEEMLLEEAKIEYDQVSQKLVLSLPLRKKVFTKIPVMIKENNAKEESKQDQQKIKLK